MHFSYRRAESSKEEKEPSLSGIKVHLAMECSPGTKRITEKQLLKGGDTLIWEREEQAQLRGADLRLPKVCVSSIANVGINQQNDIWEDIQIQGPGQGALGWALSGPLQWPGPETAGTRVPLGVPSYKERVCSQATTIPPAARWVQPQLQKKAVLNKGLCTSSSSSLLSIYYWR